MPSAVEYSQDFKEMDPLLCGFPALWPSLHKKVFPGVSDGKASVCNAGDPGSIPGLGKSPGEGNGNPFQYSCLENPNDGRRSLISYSSWGHKE